MGEENFESVLEKHGTLIYPNVGTSMMPLLRENRDLMVIDKRPQGRLSRYDVVLYRRGDSYVLHRIIEVCDNDYVLCGDHQYIKEYGVTDEMIIGVMRAVIRDGQEISTTSFGYRIYMFFWCTLFPLRAFILKIKYKLYLIKKKLLRKKH